MSIKHAWTLGRVLERKKIVNLPLYIGGLISFGSTVIFLFTLDISG